MQKELLLDSKLSRKFFKVFGHEVWLLVQDLEACFKNNPFKKEKN
jgi:uncharacterized protein (DUF1697 family)